MTSSIMTRMLALVGVRSRSLLEVAEGSARGACCRHSWKCSYPSSRPGEGKKGGASQAGVTFEVPQDGRGGQRLADEAADSSAVGILEGANVQLVGPGSVFIPGRGSLALLAFFTRTGLRDE